MIYQTLLDFYEIVGASSPSDLNFANFSIGLPDVLCLVFVFGFFMSLIEFSCFVVRFARGLYF